MTKEITRIVPFPAAKVFALVYFVLGLFFVGLMFVTTMFGSSPAPQKGRWFFLIAPFFYAIAGFVFTYIAAAIYNLVAKRFGGIQFETAERSGAQQGAPGDGPRPAGSARP